MSNIGYFADLGIGDASFKFPVIENEMIITSTSEVVARMGTCLACEFDAPASGQTVYGRLQCSGTADAALSMAAYALGG